MNERVASNLNCIVNKISDTIHELNLAADYVQDTIESGDYGDLMAVETVLYRIQRNVEDMKAYYDRTNETWEDDE